MAKTKKVMKQEITRRIDSTIAAAVNAIRDLESPSDISMVRERTIKALYGIMDDIKSYKLKETDVPICHTIYSVNRMFDEFETASKCRAIVVAEKKEISDKIEELLVEYNTALAAVPTRNDFESEYDLFQQFTIHNRTDHTIIKFNDELNSVIGFIEFDANDKIIRATESEFFIWHVVNNIPMNPNQYRIKTYKPVNLYISNDYDDDDMTVKHNKTVFIPDMPNHYNKIFINDGNVFLNSKTHKVIGATSAMSYTAYIRYANDKSRGYNCEEPVISYVSNATFRFIDANDFISFDTWDKAIDASKHLETIKSELDTLYRKRESYEQICDTHESHH